MQTVSSRHDSWRCLAVLAILVVLALACLTRPCTVRADSGPIYFSAGVLVPTTSNDIRLTREVLTVDYTSNILPTTSEQPGTVDVRARFWFRNEGKAVTQKMGFPLGREQLSGYGYFNTGFAVTLDGRSINSVEFEQQAPGTGSELTYSMWNTFEVPFAAGQTRVVDVTYRIRPRGGYFLYVLQTGRLWKGPIGDLTIDVNLGRPAAFPDLLSVQPSGYRLQGNHILWHFTNYEPQQDIEIEHMSRAFWETVRPLKEAAERTGAEADWYRYALALLPGSIIGRYPATAAAEGSASSDPLGFVRGLQTSAYADYVQHTMITALNHCMHDSPAALILGAAYRTRFASYRDTGNFLDGAEEWNTSPSTRAHELYENLRVAGRTADNASPEEARLLAWLTADMAGESMTGGYTLSAIHELEVSQSLAARTRLADDPAYQRLFQSAAAFLSAWNNARLPVGVSSIPRIEVQQQRMDTIVGGPAWRVRIILHQALPASDAAFVWTDSNTTAQPDWREMPLTDAMTGLVKDSSAMVTPGFSDADPNDYLVILSMPEVRNADEFQTTLAKLADDALPCLLYNRRPTIATTPLTYEYPADTAQEYPLQSAAIQWLRAASPTLRFDMDRGVTVVLDRNHPMSDAICDAGEAEISRITTFFTAFDWAREYKIDTTLQRNLAFIRQNRGRNPSVTTVTYAADGTIARTATTDHGGVCRMALRVALAAIGGLAAGIALGFLVARRQENSASKPVQ